MAAGETVGSEEGRSGGGGEEERRGRRRDAKNPDKLLALKTLYTQDQLCTFATKKPSPYSHGYNQLVCGP